MDSTQAFLGQLAATGYARATIEGYRSLLHALARFAEQREIDDPARCSQADLLAFMDHCRATRSGAVMFNVLCRLKQYYRYLVEEDLIFFSPIETHSVPKLRSVSREIRTGEQMRELLDAVRTDTPLHLRTKAILELAYSSALRSCEIRRLRLDRIDFANGTIAVEKTKTRTDRTVPVGTIALEWIGRYLKDIRPRFVNGRDHPLVFISLRGGTPLSASGFWRGIHTTLTASGITPVKPHSVRASSATALLEAGMHVGFIAELLGHTELSTTQVYLRMNERALSTEIQQHHPRNHMEE